MKIAENLAYKYKGLTGSNPAVGCVIVKNDRIISLGHTGEGGSPHAEYMALRAAGKLANGADMYVTLEPCSHYGKNPPCDQYIIRAGIKNLYIGNLDPSDKVASIDNLRNHNINVEMMPIISYSMSGFLSSHIHKRPFITVKLAISLDGKIACNNGNSKWITGEVARHYAHLLRYRNDAILVGNNTYKRDKPRLDCRIDNMQQHSPKPLIADKKLQIEDIYRLPEQGINNLLIEGGGKIVGFLLQNNLIDRLELIIAPIIIGDNALAMAVIADIMEIKDSYQFRHIASRKLGKDRLEIYDRSYKSTK